MRWRALLRQPSQQPPAKPLSNNSGKPGFGGAVPFICNRRWTEGCGRDIAIAAARVIWLGHQPPQVLPAAGIAIRSIRIREVDPRTIRIPRSAAGSERWHLRDIRPGRCDATVFHHRTPRMS